MFGVLGGGTAIAAYVVSSNSQVGPGTISGHNPPSGDHANIIGGSVNAQDLAAGAVTPSKLGAVKKFRQRNATSTSDFATIMSLGGLKLHYQCQFSGDTTKTVMVATSTVDHATITQGFITGAEGFGSSFFNSDQDFSPDDVFSLTHNRSFGEGNVVYSTPGGAVVTLDYGFQVSPCLAHGVAVER